MPAGTPPLAKASTSSAVKSGLLKVSFSYSAPQGSSGSREVAPATSAPNFLLVSLFTTATKPSQAPLTPMGSW